MAKLATTVYESGPKDELIVKDVYEAGGSGVVNFMHDKSDGAIDAADAAGGEGGGGGGDDGGGDGGDSGGEGGGSGGGSGGGGGGGGGSGGNDPLGDFISSMDEGGPAGFDDLEGGVADAFDKMGSFGEDLASSAGLAESVAGGLGDIFGGDLASLSGLVDGVADKFTDIAGFSDIDKLAAGFDLEAITAQLANGSTDILSSIRNLPANLQNMITGGVDPSQIKNNVFASVGNAISKITPDLGLPALTPVAGLINTLTDGAYAVESISRGGLSALVSGVTNLGNKLNLPNVFSSIAANVTDNGVLMNAALPLLQRAVVQGDVDIFKDIAASRIGGAVQSLVPAVVPALVANMRKPADLAQQEYPRYYQGLREAMDTVTPGWDRMTRAGGEVVNATIGNTNPFMADLIRSQMNELMHPDNYLSNAQAIYPQSGAYDGSQSVVSVLAPSLPQVGIGSVAQQAVDLTNVPLMPDIDFSTLGDDLQPITDPTTPVVQPTQPIMSFESEPFMLLGQVFRNNSVEQELERHFPQFLASMGTPPVPVSIY